MPHRDKEGGARQSRKEVDGLLEERRGRTCLSVGGAGRHLLIQQESQYPLLTTTLDEVDPQRALPLL